MGTVQDPRMSDQNSGKQSETAGCVLGLGENQKQAGNKKYIEREKESENIKKKKKKVDGGGRRP